MNLTLIKIDETNQTCNARDLWEMLERPQGRYDMWVSRYLLNPDYGFADGIDYRTDLCRAANNKQTKEYHLFISTAKQLCMVLNNQIGIKVRKYFVEIEKHYKQLQERNRLDLTNTTDLIQFMKLTTKQLEDQQRQIEELAPKAESHDRLSNADGYEKIFTVAKNLGIKPYDFLDMLKRDEYIYKKSAPPEATQKAITAGLMVIKNRAIRHGEEKEVMHYTTYITAKGATFFDKKYNARQLATA